MTLAKRIGLLHWSAPRTVAGAESHVADLARMLLKEGREVTVITGEPEPLLPDGSHQESAGAMGRQGRAHAASTLDLGRSVLALLQRYDS